MSTNVSIAKPAHGDRVRRFFGLKKSDPERGILRQMGHITGTVLAVVDDKHALDGWVALVRWWDPSRRRHMWDVHHAYDFSPERADVTRIDVMKKGANRR
jgi:hypothetical protein